MAVTNLEIHRQNSNAGLFAVRNDAAYLIRPGSDKIAACMELRKEDEKVANIMGNYEGIEPLTKEAADVLNSRGVTWSAEGPVMGRSFFFIRR